MPVLEQVVLAGKSMLMLQNLGQLGAVVEKTGSGTCEYTLVSNHGLYKEVRWGPLGRGQ